MALILPLAVFLALGFSVGDMEIEITTDSGNVDLFHVRDVLLAGNISWVIAVFGVIGLPQSLVEFRQHGVFRRYRVTPMPSYALGDPMAVGAAVIVASLALMLVVGWAVFGIRFAGNVAMVALAILVSYMAFAALGILSQRRRGSKYVGEGPLFTLDSSSAPLRLCDSLAALRVVGDWLPLTHSYDLLTHLWLGATWEVETTIGVPVWVSFAYLGGIAAVGVAVSGRLFRWD